MKKLRNYVAKATTRRTKKVVTKILTICSAIPLTSNLKIIIYKFVKYNIDYIVK